MSRGGEDRQSFLGKKYAILALSGKFKVMMSQFDLAYLQNILDTMGLVETYLEQTSEEEYYNDPLLQDGIIRLLDFIGETARHISSDLKGEHPEFPWQDLLDLNHRMSTSTAGVDKEAAWVTARDRIPALKEDIRLMAEDLIQEQN
ncbi:MAG: HepT-like ribonuclease domain-containing protein [Anaerolineales bacterium]